MTNAMYHIVLFAGLSSTFSQATAEMVIAPSCMSGMMRRETKQEIEATREAETKREVEVTAHAFAQSTKPQESKDASKSGIHHKADHHQESEHEKKAKESDKADALTRDSVKEKHGKRHSDDTQGKDEPHLGAKKEDRRKDAHQADGVKKLGAHEKHSLEKTSDSVKHHAEDQHEGHSHSLDKTKKQAKSEKQQDGTHATHSGIKHSRKEKKEEGAHTLDKEAAHGDSKDTSKKNKGEKLAKDATRVEAAEDAGHVRDMGDSKKDEASTIEEIAKEVEALHLTESELDPDENYHAHKHEAFQVKVTGPEGNELCLSEVHHGYQVRADKCNGAHGQHWYWNKGGRQLKTLRSATRCLGYMFGKHEHRLAMYPCDDSGPESSHTAWKMDSDGRLRAIDTDRCMAFDEAEDKKVNAITSLCDE